MGTAVGRTERWITEHHWITEHWVGEIFIFVVGLMLGALLVSVAPQPGATLSLGDEVEIERLLN